MVDLFRVDDEDENYPGHIAGCFRGSLAGVDVTNRGGVWVTPTFTQSYACGSCGSWHIRRHFAPLFEYESLCLTVGVTNDPELTRRIRRSMHGGVSFAFKDTTKYVVSPVGDVEMDTAEIAFMLTERHILDNRLSRVTYIQPWSKPTKQAVNETWVFKDYTVRQVREAVMALGYDTNIPDQMEIADIEQQILMQLRVMYGGQYAQVQWPTTTDPSLG